MQASPAQSLRRKRSTLRGGRPLPLGPRHIRRTSDRQLPSPLQSPSGASDKYIAVALPSPLRRSSPLESLASMSSADATIKSLVSMHDKQDMPVSPPPTAECLYSPPPSAPPMLSPTLKLPRLTPAPVINFDSCPIPWKGLTLQAAQASLTSSELQGIVSRAIQMSSDPSAIRLVPLEVLDISLTTECRRLSERKAAIQAKYRFHVQRRSALLQNLNAHNAHSYNTPSQDKAEDARTLAALTSQLSHTIAACDLLIEEMLQIADQEMQISRLSGDHLASALSIALHKLRRGYGRECKKALKAQNRVQELEILLEELRREIREQREPQLPAETEEKTEEARSSERENDSRAPIRPLPAVPDTPGPHDSPILKRVSVIQPPPLHRSRSIQSNRSTRSRRSNRGSRGSSVLKRRKRALAVSGNGPFQLRVPRTVPSIPSSPGALSARRRPRASEITEEPRAVSFLDLEAKDEQMLMSKWLGLRQSPSADTVRRFSRRGQESDQRSINDSKLKNRMTHSRTIAELRKLKARIFPRVSNAPPKYI